MKMSDYTTYDLIDMMKDVYGGDAYSVLVETLMDDEEGENAVRSALIQIIRDMPKGDE